MKGAKIVLLSKDRSTFQETLDLSISVHLWEGNV